MWSRIFILHVSVWNTWDYSRFLVAQSYVWYVICTAVFSPSSFIFVITVSVCFRIMMLKKWLLYILPLSLQIFLIMYTLWSSTSVYSGFIIIISHTWKFMCNANSILFFKCRCISVIFFGGFGEFVRVRD